MPTKTVALRPCEQRIVDALRDLTQERGFPPTLSELGHAVDRSPSRIHAVVDRLLLKGVITRRAPRIARGLVVASGRR